MGKLVAAVVLGAVLGALSRGSVGKTQAVRLVDVFALGPFLIWSASRSTLPAVARFLLAGSGAATIVFNGLNWLEVRGGG